MAAEDLGFARSQGISSHGIDQIWPEYSGLIQNQKGAIDKYNHDLTTVICYCKFVSEIICFSIKTTVLEHTSWFLVINPAS